jgi:YD repeat-containing protein
MSTIVATVDGWKVFPTADETARCTNFAEPPIVYVNVRGQAITQWDPNKWWNGVQLIDPGQASQDVMPRSPQNMQVPQISGMTFPLVTKGNWVISCLASTANGQPGEAFLAIAPNGMKYWFNRLTYRVLTSSSSPKGSLRRQEGDMQVTRIEDRFGNAVTYTYAADGTLSEIDGSDGRKVVLTYTVWQNPAIDQVLHTYSFPPVNLLHTASIVPRQVRRGPGHTITP